MYWDNQAKKLTTFDARETAPKAATPALLLDKTGKPLEFMARWWKSRSVGTPGVPKLMEDVRATLANCRGQACLTILCAWRSKVLPCRRAWPHRLRKTSNICAAIRLQPVIFCRKAGLWRRGVEKPEFARSVRLLARSGSALYQWRRHKIW